MLVITDSNQARFDTDLPTPSVISDIGLTEKSWANVSQTAKEFVATCLSVDPTQRPTAAEVLNLRWLADAKTHYVPGPGSADLLS